MYFYVTTIENAPTISLASADVWSISAIDRSYSQLRDRAIVRNLDIDDRLG